jgi:hypothetical protein
MKRYPVGAVCVVFQEKVTDFSVTVDGTALTNVTGAK